MNITNKKKLSKLPEGKELNGNYNRMKITKNTNNDQLLVLEVIT